MSNSPRPFAILLIISAAVVGSVIAVMFTPLIQWSKPAVMEVAKTNPNPPSGEVIFNPPKPEDAPEKIRDAVVYGYNILKNTRKLMPEYVGNNLDCTNCHFDAGRERETLSLVGVAAAYPKYRDRQDYAVDLQSRTQDCFERSMNGRSPAMDSKEMTAIITYYQWISKDLPIYTDIPWLGLKHLKSKHTADEAAGQVVFTGKCAPCHGKEGQGTPIAPPLWGTGSFNDGAGMHKFKNMSAFVKYYMPKGAPDLNEAQAMDVSEFVLNHPRPHLTKSK